MRKTETIALIVGVILGFSTVAQAIQHIGDASSAFRAAGEMFDGVPKWDPTELPRLMEMGDRFLISKARKAYASEWQAAGCEVEGFGPMDRTMCPGFRKDPKAEYQGGAQWITNTQYKDPTFPDRYEQFFGGGKRHAKPAKPTLPAGQI